MREAIGAHDSTDRFAGFVLVGIPRVSEISNRCSTAAKTYCTECIVRIIASGFHYPVSKGAAGLIKREYIAIGNIAGRAIGGGAITGTPIKTIKVAVCTIVFGYWFDTTS